MLQIQGELRGAGGKDLYRGWVVVALIWTLGDLDGYS
jgi:hypothetical protein